MRITQIHSFQFLARFGIRGKFIFSPLFGRRFGLIAHTFSVLFGAERRLLLRFAIMHSFRLLSRSQKPTGCRILTHFERWVSLRVAAVSLRLLKEGNEGEAHLTFSTPRAIILYAVMVRCFSFVLSAALFHFSLSVRLFGLFAWCVYASHFTSVAFLDSPVPRLRQAEVWCALDSMRTRTFLPNKTSLSDNERA